MGGGRVTAQEFWLKDAIANALVARCGHQGNTLQWRFINVLNLLLTAGGGNGRPHEKMFGICAAGNFKVALYQCFFIFRSSLALVFCSQRRVFFSLKYIFVKFYIQINPRNLYFILNFHFLIFLDLEFKVQIQH